MVGGGRGGVGRAVGMGGGCLFEQGREVGVAGWAFGGGCGFRWAVACVCGVAWGIVVGAMAPTPWPLDAMGRSGAAMALGLVLS